MKFFGWQELSGEGEKQDFDSKPLFEYTNYITYISYELYNRIIDWLRVEKQLWLHQQQLRDEKQQQVDTLNLNTYEIFTNSWLRSEKQRVDALDLNTYKMLCDKQQQQRLHDEEEQRLHDEKKQLVDASNLNTYEMAVKIYLIAMLIRTGKNLKYVYLDDILCDHRLMNFENLTAITTLELYFSFNQHFLNCYKYMAIDGLVKILYKSTTLTSLCIDSVKPEIRGTKMLLNALSNNTVINTLSLRFNQISLNSREVEKLADFIRNNIVLISLNISYNELGKEGREALLAAFCVNTSIKYLNLEDNRLESEIGKAFKDMLCKNTTLISLDISKNELRSGGIMLAGAVSKNTTLIYLNLKGNKLGLEVATKLAEALLKNTTLRFLMLVVISSDEGVK